jgi:hypothetical protein
MPGEVTKGEATGPGKGSTIHRQGSTHLVLSQCKGGWELTQEIY